MNACAELGYYSGNHRVQQDSEYCGLYIKTQEEFMLSNKNLLFIYIFPQKYHEENVITK